MAGSVLLIKGRPLAPLPAEVLGCFSHSIVDVSEERRTGAQSSDHKRSISTVQSGMRTAADVTAAFE